MKKNFALYYILLIFSVTFWGSSYVFSKHLLESIAPIHIIFIRTVLAALFLLIFSLILYKKELKIEKKDIKYILILSVFEPVFYFIFETYSLQYTTASIVSIIVATIPLFSALMSKYYFKEIFTKLNMIGVVISMIGIGIMLLPGFYKTAGGILGIVLAFLAVATAVGYGFFLKKISSKYSPVAIVAYQNMVGAVLFLPIFLIYSFRNGFPAMQTVFEPVNISYIIILAVFCSALAFIFFIQGIQKIGLGKTHVFNNLTPAVTALTSFLLLGEEFPFYKIIGMVVVIVGIFLVQRNRGN